MIPRQVLVIGSIDRLDEAALEGSGWRMAHRASERVGILEFVESRDTPLPIDIPGLRLVTSEDDLSAVSPPLTDGEVLFCRGWLARQTDEPERRIGEGLDWDAPGFTAPDPPPAKGGDRGA